VVGGLFRSGSLKPSLSLASFGLRNPVQPRARSTWTVQRQAFSSSPRVSADQPKTAEKDLKSQPSPAHGPPHKHQTAPAELFATEGLNKQQAIDVCKSLKDAGALLYQSAQSMPANGKLQSAVFDHMKELNKELTKLLDIHTIGEVKHDLAVHQEQLALIRKEVAPLELAQLELERQASRRAKQIMWASLGYCVIQAALVGRLTWWELSWDVMEPVTYMLTFVTAIIGLTYFNLTDTEYTYEGLKRTLTNRKLAKLYRSKGFDAATFEKLKQDILLNENHINRLKFELRPATASAVSAKVSEPAGPAPKITPTA